MGPGRGDRYFSACPSHSRSCSASCSWPASACSPIPAPISGCFASRPSGEAAPTTSVTVTFDRPVAGSLDRTVDPRAVFTIAPAVPGTLDWRDPVTIRFRPAAPLAPNATYTVTVADAFTAMDGSRLASPYSSPFRVRGPRVLAGSPVGPNGGAPSSRPTRGSIWWWTRRWTPPPWPHGAYLEFDRAVLAPGVGPGSGSSPSAPITADDRWDFREAGGWDRDRSADPLRRVVRLAPAGRCRTAAPASWWCPPRSTTRSARLQRWGFATYGDFRLTKAACGWSRAPARPDRSFHASAPRSAAPSCGGT